MFDLLRFATRFLRARLREIQSDFPGAAALLAHGPVPTRYQSVADVYRLRMLVLADIPERGPEIISRAETLPWFQNPQSSGDEYARGYCQYVAAGVRGDISERRRWAQELGRLSVKPVYRRALNVTE